MRGDNKQTQAWLWLIAATALWGLSFPVIKAILFRQQLLLPEAGSAFLAAMTVVMRFGVAAGIVALFCWRTLPQLTRNEMWQGAGLAFFGGVGILLQMDGLAHTKASTSAFLTQFYCLLIPIWVVVRTRVPPTPVVVVSSLMVLTGVAILADVDWRAFRIGRGEGETLLAATAFAGQILWLERPRFAGNKPTHFSVVMFAGTALLCLPLALAWAPHGGAMMTVCADAAVIMLTLVLVLFCTVAAYLLMNTWQPHLSATQAGLVYCVEPVAATLCALVLPGWLSRLAHIDYPNERWTAGLLTGGALILVANVILQIEASRRARKNSDPAPQLAGAATLGKAIPRE